MGKTDRRVLAIILVLAGLVALVFYLPRSEEQASTYLSIQVDGEEVDRIDLVEENIGLVYEVPSDLGENTIRITEEGATMVHASCPDQHCIHMAPISQEGETIICLPHRLVLEVKGAGDDQGLDHMVR